MTTPEFKGDAVGSYADAAEPWKSAPTKQRATPSGYEVGVPDHAEGSSFATLSSGRTDSSVRKPAVVTERPTDILNRQFTGLIESFDTDLTAASLRDAATYRSHVVEDMWRADSELRIASYLEAFPEIYTPAETMVLDTRTGLEVPVGAYGQRWAEQLLSAAHRLDTNLFSTGSNVNILYQTGQVAATIPETLEDYTYYGGRSAASPDERVQLTHHEGAVSAELYSAGQLTHYAVPGYERAPQQGYRQLIMDGVISRLSRKIPPGVSGQMNKAGMVFAVPPVEIGPNNRRVLSSVLTDHWKDNRDSYPVSTRRDMKLPVPGCPVGYKLPGNSLTGVDLGALHLAEHMGGKRIPLEAITRPKGGKNT